MWTYVAGGLILVKSRLFSLFFPASTWKATVDFCPHERDNHSIVKKENDVNPYRFSQNCCADSVLMFAFIS